MTEPLDARLPIAPDTPAAARRATMRHAGLRVEPAALTNAVLLVSELVTAVVEAGEPGELALHVEMRDADLRIEVRRLDGTGAAQPVPQLDGYGHAIVERLSDAWGAKAPDGGPALWFELRAAVTRRARDPEHHRRAAGVRST